MSKYIKWKLFCDLVLCQVSRDKEDEEGERRGGAERGRENRRKGISARRERERERVNEGQNRGKECKTKEDEREESIEE